MGNKGVKPLKVMCQAYREHPHIPPPPKKNRVRKIQEVGFPSQKFFPQTYLVILDVYPFIVAVIQISAHRKQNSVKYNA